MEHPAIAYLPKNDHCHHGNNDYYRSYNQPGSRGFSLPRRLHALLCLLVCDSLSSPAGLFFPHSPELRGSTSQPLIESRLR
jgi:hypothetical protein